MRKETILSVFLAVLLCWGSALALSSPGRETVKAAQRLQPSDLEYVGAFRLPEGVPGSDVRTWAWGGFAMTYYPNGDPNGPDDGYPGSIYGAGHAWEHQVSEISIPVPVISPSKNLNHLNTASTLQSFRDIFDVGSLEMPRTGLAYLPKQGSQSTDKLYFCRGQHLQDEANFLTHGWCELNLSNPRVKGTWYLDCPHNLYNTNDLLFDIPTDWAAAHTPGKLLATGRFRDGGWSGQGPSLFAIGPWNQGNPPPSGTSLSYVTLLRYTSTEDPESWDEPTNHTMTDYHHSDEWSGAAWVTAGNKTAVIFVGTKGTGDCWYGDSNGPCLECQGERGWWSTGFEGQFIFYDPDDLAQAAAGTMESWQPQPYASLNVDQYLYHIESSQQWYHLGAACFDRTRGYLYVFEPYVDDDKPIVHVWKVSASGNGSTETGVISLNRSRMNFGAITNGVSPDSQTFSIDNTGTGTMNWTVSDNTGWLTCTPASGTDAGVVTVSVDPSGLSAGTYSRTITVSSSDASNSPRTITVTLKVFNPGTSGQPFGLYATPENGAVVSGSVPFTGWVLDDIGVESVKLYRQDSGSMVYIGDAVLVEGARPDVEQAHPDYPMNYKAGWGYMMLTNFLSDSGNGTFTIYAVAADKEGHQVSLGAKTITCDNANAVKPFGAIDTPAQGDTVSGSSFRNQGWVLTPLPNAIPTDGSTIQVLVDGVNLGNPVYNGYRSDIADLFPGYANSSGAAAYFDFDTTAFENGVHTIAWIAADNAGNSGGIGSRYFTIQNPAGSRQQGAWSRESMGHGAWSRGGMEHGAWSREKSISCLEPVGVIKGYARDVEPRMLFPDDNGMITIEIKELERLEIHLNNLNPSSFIIHKYTESFYSGWLVVGDEFKPLPIGSTLDAAGGIFYWQAGPGFVGTYDFVFLKTQDGKPMQKRIKINIIPKFKRNGEKNEK